MRRAELIAQIAPVAPPCFETRAQWVAYLSSAAEAQKPEKRVNGPDSRAVLIRQHEGAPLELNYQFAYCADCSAQHSHAMLTKGKCKPRHLIDMQPAKTEVAA